MAENDTHEVQVKRNPVIRALLLLGGFIFLGIGIAGYVVPGLPGTVFVLISAACFFRSSQKFYDVVTFYNGINYVAARPRPRPAGMAAS